MKQATSRRFLYAGSLAAAIASLLAAPPAAAASITWNGGGADLNWSSAANWGGAVAASGDDLTFSGATGLNPYNDGLTRIGTVNLSADGFTISGNALTLNGDFTNAGNNTWSINSTLGAARIFTSHSGILTLSGSITNAGFLTTVSGAGATTLSGILGGGGGLAKSGTGMLTLTGTNTYSGTTSIAPGGTLSISQDANLGTAPASAALGSLVIDGNPTDGNGVLATTASFTLNANRGIRIGPSSGIGAGTINVATDTVLSYGGIISSNGTGTGGLTKAGAGTLVLSGANTYTGTTTIAAGILKLGGTSAIPSGLGKGNVVVTGTLELNANSITLNGLSGAGTITSSAAGSVNLTVGGNNQGNITEGVGYTGVISNGSGTIGLSKIGTGTWTLGGNNTFSGGVVINAGTVQLGHANGLGVATNSVTFGPNAPVGTSGGTKLQLNGNSVIIGGLATNDTPGTVVVENANASNATLTVNQAGNTTFAGVLQNGSGAGTLGLTKSGAGTLTLSGTNTFTGTATISAGTLALSGGAAIADATAVSLNNISGATLLLNANETIGSLAGGGATGGNVNLQGFTLTTGGATTYSGTISGTGSLIKTGIGVFMLSAANTYTGGTNIREGQIALGIDNAMVASTVLTLGGGTTSGVLKLNNFNQTLAGLTTAGTGTGNRVINDNATTKTLTLNNTNNYTFVGILGGTTANENNFNLVKSGAGTMTLSGANTYTGTSTITGGTLSVGDISNALGNGLGTGASAIALSGGTLSYTGNDASFTRGFTVSSIGGQIDTTTAGKTLTLSTGNVAIAGAGNFTVGGAGNTSIFSNITGASGILNKTGTGTLTLSGANTYTGATNIRNGTLALGVNNGVSQGATLTLGDGTANTNGVLRLNGLSQTLSGLSTAGSGIGNRVTGGSSTLSNLTINNSGASPFAGILGGTIAIDNNLALTKTGAGVLTLSGTSTYTGGTTISAGTIAVSAATNLGASGGGLSIGNGTLQVTNDLTSARNISLTSASSAILVDSAKTYTNSGAITGNGALNLTGSGTLLVSGTSNAYTGGTNIRSGTLTLGAANSLPTNTLVTLGNLTVSGRLALNGFSQTVAGLATSGTGTTNRIVNGKSTAATLTVNNASDITFGGILGGSTANENNFGLTKSGAGKLTITGTNTYTGNTTVTAGTLAIASATAIPSGAGNGNVQVDGTLDVNGFSPSINGFSGSGIVLNNGATGRAISVGNNNQTSDFLGIIQDGTGTLGLTKVGTGTLTVSNANTFSGGVIINAGTLQLNNASGLGATTNSVTFGASAPATTKLQLNGKSVTIGALSTNATPGTVVVENANAAATTLTISQSSSSTFAGVLQDGTGGGALSLTKSGAGVLTLSGANTYTGNTTISAGTLKLGGNNTLPTGTGKGDVIVSSGATLDINGRTSTNATINRLTGDGTVTNSSATTGLITIGNNNTSSTFNGAIQNGTGLVTLVKTGTGTLTLTPSGNNAFTGGVTINAGVVQAGNEYALNSAGTNVVTFGSNVAVGTKLQINGNNITIAGLASGSTTGSPVVENANANATAGILTIHNNSSPLTYASAINDGGGVLSLVKTGLGTQILTGTSNYSGGTTISGGILSISKDAALGATSGALTIGNGKLQVTAAIAPSPRNISLTDSASTIVVDPTFTYIEAGIISGTGTLNKEGKGILQLTGSANTYSGGTTITAGLLDIITTAVGTPLGSGNINVSAGGNLSLSSINNKASQTITVASDSSAKGGIGFSNTALTQNQLTGMFTDSTGIYGGVLGINVAAYPLATNPINLSSLGTGNWFLGSAGTGSISGTSLTVGAGGLYRLGGGGGSLTLTTANVLTGSNSIQVGFGTTNSNGDGTVIVSSNQDYTGTTTISNGTLRISTEGTAAGVAGGLGKVPASASAGNIVINGGTLSFNPTATLTLHANRGIALGPADGSAGTGTIDVQSGKTVSYAGIIANTSTGAGSLVKTGTGTLALSGNASTYSGSTSINGGTLSFTGINDLGVGTDINFNGGTLFWVAGNTADISARTITVSSTGGGILNTNHNSVTFSDKAITGTGLLTLTTGTGTLTLGVANSYAGNTTISAGSTVKLGNVGAIPSGSGKGTATISGTLDLNNLSPTLNLLTGAGTITNTASGSAALTVDTANSTNGSSFSGALNNGSGTTSLIKSGANSLTLTGITSTYSGGTTVNGTGTLLVSDDLSLGAVPGSATAGNITIATGATFGTSTNDVTISSNRGIAINGATAASINVAAGKALTYGGVIANAGATIGGLTKASSTGILYLTGSNTYAGDTTVLGGVLKIGNASAIPFGVGKGKLSVASANSGAVDLNGFNITVNGLTGAGSIRSNVAGNATITVGDANATSSFTGTIVNGNASAVVGVTKIGTGTLTLSGTNTYTGGTTITGGIVNISRESALGASSGNLTFNGNGATLQLAATIPTSTPSTRNMVLTTDGTIDTSTFSLNASGTISGAGGLSKSGAGTLALSGVNSYSGNTTVTVGTLQLANVAAVPSGTGKGNLSLASGTTLDLNNLNPTVNGLTGAGTVTNSQTGAVTFTAGANDASDAFSGIILNGNGTVAFTKTGTGILILSGTNTFTGTTMVSAGTLALAGGTVIPDTGAVVLADTAGAVLQLNAAESIGSLAGGGKSGGNVSLQGYTLTTGAGNSDTTYNGAISGTGGLTKTGTGKLTLGGTNTYSGPTTISTGTLALGSDKGLSSNSTLTIFGPGFLDIHGNSVAMDGLLGTGTILNNGLADATLTAGAAGGSTSFAGVIADGSKAIALTKSGVGTLTLTGINTYSGNTTIANGTLSVANIGAGGNLGTGTNPIILGDVATKGTLSYTGATDLSYTRGFTVNAGGGEINTTAAGKTLTLQGTDITTAGIFTVSGAGNALVQSVITGAGGLTKANSGSMILSSVNTYSGDTTISYGTLQVTNAAAIPSGTGKGNVAVGASGMLDVNSLSLTLNGLSGVGTVTNTAGSPVTLTLGGNDATANFTGIIQDGSGVTSLVKIGTGIQTLGGTNTYSGDTTVSAGTLQFGIATAIPSGSSKGNVVMEAGGTLDLNDFEASINGLSGSGLVTNNSGASTISVGNNNQASEFTGTIKDGLGTIGLTKTGTGMLTLSGNSTFSGATAIDQGTLSMGSATGLSSRSTLTIGNAGALDLNGKVIAIDGLAGTGSITNNSATQVTLTIGSSGGSGTFGGTINDGAGVIGLVKAGSGTVTLGNVNTYSGGTTVTGGLLAITSYGALGKVPDTVQPGNIVLNGGGISATNSFEIDSRRGITVGPASDSGFGVLDAALNQTLTYNGIIADNGTGGLTKTGLGTLTLGGVNTYSGDTTISSGALQIGNALAIPTGLGKGNVVLNATLDLNKTSITVNGLSGSGLVSNTKLGPVTLSVGDNNQNSTFAGVIENGNGTTILKKVGSGVLTLSGANTYTGGTIITAGKLSVASSEALGLESNNLTIGSGAALQVTDSFHTSRSTILDGTPGATTGGTFEVASGKILEYTSSSVISGTGSLIKTGEGTLSLGGVDTYTGGTYIKAGTLVSTSGQAPGPQPPAGSNLYAHHIYDGATLQIAVGSWATERQIELMGDPEGSGGSSGMATIDITNGFTQQRNGLIYGDGKLNLVGTGTMIVTNANTYIGGTIVEHGVLQVNNSTGSATGTGDVTVRNGGTLSVLPTTHGSYAEISGAISGTVTIESTGKLLTSSDDPSIAGNQTLTLGGLNLNEGSLSTFKLGALTTTPAVNITGSDLFKLPTTGLSTIDIINTGAMGIGTYHLFDYVGTEFTTEYFQKLMLAEAHSGLFNLRLVNNTTNTSIDLGVEAISQQWKKNGTNTNWSENPWWTESPYTVPNGEGATALFINNNYLQPTDPVFDSTETATLDTDVKLGSLIFNNATTAFTLNPSTGKTLTLDEVGNGNAVIQVINASGSNHEINVPVILNDNLTVALASGMNISGAISGADKSLTKTGTGTLTLSGTAANTYSGLTEVVDGTLNLNKSVGINALGGGLQIDSGGTVVLLASNQIADGTTVTVNGTFALGTHSETIAGLTGGGTVTTGNGSVLTLQSDANSSFLGVISGSGGIAKAGTGTLTLDGINTYTGGTAINGGTLHVGADNNLGGSGGLTFDGGTLAFSAGVTSARNILLNSGGGTFDTDNNNVVLTGLISGSGTLTKTGLGTLRLNTANDYTGATVIKNGIVQIGNNTALGTGPITVMADGELEFNGDGLTSSNPLTLAGGELCTLVGTNTYTGPITLTANSVVDADSDKLIITGNIGEDGGSFGLTKKGPGTVELTGTNTYTGATEVAAGTLSLSNGAAIADTGAIILANTPGVQLLLNASETIGSLAGGGGGGGNVQLTTFTLTTGDASNTTFAGVIISSGAGGALTKQGEGTLTLTGANTYTGLTTVSAGALNIQNAMALGTSAGGTTVAAGAALQLQGNLTVGAEALTLNGQGIGTTGALRNLSSSNTYGGLLTLGSATRINSDAGALTISNTGTITGSYDLTVGGAGNTTISSIIGTESGTLTKDGSGILTLSGANTYAGDTIVTAGTLRMDNEFAIPSGTGKGNLSLAATLDLNNTRVTVNGLFGTGLVTNTQTGTAAITVGANNQTSTFGGMIADGIGTTALAKTGTGILTLTGSNHYSGGTTIAAGTLSVGADGNLGTAPSTIAPGNLVIGAGATLVTSATFALDSNRGIAVGPTGAGIIDVAAAQTLSYGGAIADNGGSGGFTKAGSGTLVLSGNSSYSGATTVSAGLLTVNGSIAVSASTVVKSSGTLSGTGTTSSLTVEASGTLAPGDNGIGPLAVEGTLVLGGIAHFELGTPGASHASTGQSDRVAVTGNVVYGGTLNLSDNANAGGLGSAGAGSYRLITYSGTAAGNFDVVNGLPAFHNALRDVSADKALYIDMYNYAVATVTPLVDLGRIHAGGAFGTQALTVGNSAAAGDFTESLGGAFGTTATGFTSSGSVTGIAGQANNASNMVVGISDNTAGQKAGLIGVSFTSQAVSGSGLIHTALASQNVTVNGFAYTGQSTWAATGSGSWGNNTNDFGRWDSAGGVPGLDGTLSANDTATFGNAISASATVTFDGASPSLKAVTFDSANSYTLAQGTNGALTLNDNGSMASITAVTGNHSISAPITLGSGVEVAVTQAGATLALSGGVSGAYGLTKTGAGTLALDGGNSFTGTTLVSAGTLDLKGTLANTKITVANLATLTGSGAIGDSITKAASLTVQTGGTHAPGDAGPGSQTINGAATYEAGSIFAWDLNTPADDIEEAYDHVAVSGKLTGTDATFQIALGGTSFSDNFWNTAKHWDVFSSGAGSTDLASIFTVFAGTDIASTGLVSGQGQFSFSGNTLNWSVVPEPTSTLVGLLIGAGLLRRQRKERAIFPPAGPPPVFQRCQHPR